MSDRKFVKVSHLIEDGQQIIMGVNEEGEVDQFLEYIDGEWCGVAGISSGIPLDCDLVELISKREFVENLTTKVTRYSKDESGKTYSVTTIEPASDEVKARLKPEMIVVVDSKTGPQQLKYERVEPPDCDDVKLFGRTTIAQGYYIVDDDGKLDDEVKKPDMQPH